MAELVDSVGEGRLPALRALRDRIAEGIDETRTNPAALAALSLRFMDVLAQIEDAERAEPAVKGTALDEFTRRRAERQAAGSARSAKRQQRGG